MKSPVRLATPEDRAAVEQLVVAAYRHYVPLIGVTPGPMRDDYAAAIARGQVHVAEQDDTIAGLLVLIPQVDSLLLDNIAVLPSAQGTGLGRRLLDWTEVVARDLGLPRIVLYTHEAMTRNIALYTRHGYVETHRVEEIGLRRVYMAKTLLPAP